MGRHPSEAARDVDIVFTMVFGPKQIEQIIRGENGLLHSMRPGQVWVDLTTNQPELARMLAQEIITVSYTHLTLPTKA